ncbi:class I SAM-dependent methyltransferase [Nocardia sp. NEAU-G5]|uniref:Class I SAM-dependent methyltransferase n=1 Tax=Nocardia albiluteola TaxID=2842303 RepID=A0ABS6AYY9_9NOCA|nr:class I SAM-dependent methyltransferase [Nocardia albiluteola]MBU3063219.1 class I SAM-dependent methyltransferase [Nocardia albiluteola]
MSAEVGTIDWQGWLRRWDAQQEGYVPEREARFTAMFDAVAELLPTSFVAVDLGCGPGAISQRLLARFSGARSVAVDIDPVMVALGRGAVGTVDDRLRWVEADLSSPNLLEAIGETQVDVVLSTTALHWLQPDALARLYQDLVRLLRPGGLFLNGDNLAYPPALPTFDQLSHRVLKAQWSDTSFAERGIETAEQWWEALAEEPGFRPLIAERAQRFQGKQRPGQTDVDAHIEALSAAGFSEIGTIWQVLSNRVLLAVR